MHNVTKLQPHRSHVTTVDFVARMGSAQDRNGAVTEKMTVETGAMRLDVVSCTCYVTSSFSVSSV